MNDKVNILLKEYELHRSELKMRIDHRLRGFTFFSSATLVVLGLALKDNVYQIFLVFPWFILGFLAYLGHQILCSQLTITYLKDIEKRIGYLDYERSIIDSKWYTVKIYKSPNGLLQLLSLSPFIILLAYSIYESLICLINLTGYTFAFLYIVLLLSLFIAVFHLIQRGVKELKILPYNRAYNDND